MNEHEQDKRHAFDAFCKRVLKNEAVNAYLELERLSRREVNFSELTRTEEHQLQYIDEYFPDRRIFNVRGMEIEIADGDLVKALAALPADQRDMILLAYLLDFSDAEIASQLGLKRSTVQYRRTTTLGLLRKLMMEE